MMQVSDARINREAQKVQNCVRLYTQLCEPLIQIKSDIYKNVVGVTIQIENDKIVWIERKFNEYDEKIIAWIDAECNAIMQRIIRNEGNLFRY